MVRAASNPSPNPQHTYGGSMMLVVGQAAPQDPFNIPQHPSKVPQHPSKSPQRSSVCPQSVMLGSWPQSPRCPQHPPAHLWREHDVGARFSRALQDAQSVGVSVCLRASAWPVYCEHLSVCLKAPAWPQSGSWKPS